MRTRSGRFRPFIVIGLIAALAILLPPLWGASAAKNPPKELPMLVTLSELAAEPSRYDGHRVVVQGVVRSIEIQTGRRGSEYTMLILEEAHPEASDPVPLVSVVSLLYPTKVRQGNLALVQGVYHREGRQAGRPFEHFIDAEIILRDNH